MAYTPLEHRGFGGGLNLRDQPAVGDETQAIDLLNVEFSERGAVTQRGGYAKFNATELTNQPDSGAPFYKTDGTKRLIVGNGNRLDALDVSGASLHNAAPTANPHYFARFGGPGAERIFIANGTDTVRYYDGGFTTPSYTGTTPDGKFLAVTPWDNRMLNANRVGTAGGDNPSSVRFSAPGDPLTWDADDWNDLLPGDGTQIMGMCTWRDLVFVFKENKFFVIYQTGVDGTGDDTLLYRPIDTGVGLNASGALGVSDEGVYFLSYRGIYRTTGYQPELVSDLISPIFDGGASVFYKSGVLSHLDITKSAMTIWQDHRVIVAIPTAGSTTNNLMLVFDPQGGNWWSLFDIPASFLSTFRVASDEDLVFGYPTGLKHIGRHRALDSGYLADDMSAAGIGGNAITARWRSGWTDYGQPNMKTIRESRIWGSGALLASLSADYLDAAGAQQALTLSSSNDLWGDGLGSDLWGDGTGSDTWGPSGSINPRLMRQAIRGSVISTQFSNNVLNQTFSVHRLDHHLREVRPPSVVRS